MTNTSGTCLAQSPERTNAFMERSCWNGRLANLNVPSRYHDLLATSWVSCWSVANMRWRRSITLTSTVAAAGLEDVCDCFSFYPGNNLSSSIGTNWLGMVVGCLTCGEHTNRLDDSGLAMVSFWVHRALPVGRVRPLATNVVREAQAVNQFGFPSLWSFLDEMKRGGNIRLWMERDRLRIFQWHLHWYFYWLWTGVSKWRGGFIIWKKAKFLINHQSYWKMFFTPKLNKHV